MLRSCIRRDLVDYAPIDFVFKVHVPFALLCFTTFGSNTNKRALLGDTQIRTGGWGICNPLPYHLAMSPILLNFNQSHVSVHIQDNHCLIVYTSTLLARSDRLVLYTTLYLLYSENVIKVITTCYMCHVAHKLFLSSLFSVLPVLPTCSRRGHKKSTKRRAKHFRTNHL